jgi:DNA-directed RNA polymerase beta subunit
MLFKFGLHACVCSDMLLLLSYCVVIQETPDEGWHDLVAKGFIEYIDTEEEETTMISMTITVSQFCSP